MKKIITICLLLFSIGFSQAQTTEDYIAENVDRAQDLMHAHQLPASIILAVAIHESAAGKSKIAQYLNNHFGIKGENSNTEIRSAYKDYPSVDSSYQHFVSFLQSRSYFNVLFDRYDQYDYINWAKGIQRGGYARSRSWANQIIGLIKKYELFQYDERPDDYVEPEAPIEVTTASTSLKAKAVTAKKGRLYIVKKGDSLNKIAARAGTTATALMRKNGLKSAALKPGQKIKL